MFRRSSKVKDTFGRYISTEAVDSVLKGDFSTDSQQERQIEFIWVWFTNDQIEGPELGEAIYFAIDAGGFFDVFAPILAIWCGLFDTESDTAASAISQQMTKYTVSGAKMIRGVTSGIPRHIGSQGHMSYTVTSPDRHNILTQLAKADAGAAIAFETGANKAS